MLIFILACLAFPEAIKPAQDEIDEVVGRDRSPDWQDEEKLVYCKTLVKEVFRWKSVSLWEVSLVPQPKMMYLIPEGTRVIVFPAPAVGLTDIIDQSAAIMFKEIVEWRTFIRLEGRSACANLIDSREGGYSAIYNTMCVCNLRHLACVTECD